MKLCLWALLFAFCAVPFAIGAPTVTVKMCPYQRNATLTCTDNCTTVTVPANACVYLAQLYSYRNFRCYPATKCFDDSGYMSPNCDPKTLVANATSSCACQSKNVTYTCMPDQVVQQVCADEKCLTGCRTQETAPVKRCFAEGPGSVFIWGYRTCRMIDVTSFYMKNCTGQPYTHTTESGACADITGSSGQLYAASYTCNN